MSEPGPVAPAVYPADLEREITLWDGTRLRLRPIRPDDAPRLVEHYARLSAHSAYQRFFAAMRRLPPDWARFLAEVDYRRRLALVVERGPREAPELIAVARYEPTDHPDTAEVAFVVLDGWQGKGIGTALLEDLLAAAEARGVRRFRAWVLADNPRMLDLLDRFTDVKERKLESGVVGLTFTRRPTGRIHHEEDTTTPPSTSLA
jgi:RimJ/RimL family protein N-acetyltransferase